MRQALRAELERCSSPDGPEALMAMLLQESDAEALLDAAARAPLVHFSAASRLELGLVAEST
ncbi:MAG: hypothetical protein WBN89_11105, partial [Prochlorococcaceae cyanobacterium]